MDPDTTIVDSKWWYNLQNQDESKIRAAEIKEKMICPVLLNAHWRFAVISIRKELTKKKKISKNI